MFEGLVFTDLSFVGVLSSLFSFSELSDVWWGRVQKYLNCCASLKCYLQTPFFWSNTEVIECNVKAILMQYQLDRKCITLSCKEEEIHFINLSEIIQYVCNSFSALKINQMSLNIGSVGSECWTNKVMLSG